MELVRVVRGEPSDDEIAALVIALFVATSEPGDPPEPESRWRAAARPRTRFHRDPVGRWAR